MLKSVIANKVPLLSYIANLYAAVGNVAEYTVNMLSPATTSVVDLDTALFAISNILIVTVCAASVFTFILTSVVTQKSLFQGKSIGFVELSSNEKRDILCKLARLDVYDNLFNDTSTKLRSLKSELNKYNIQLKKYDKYGKDSINIRLNINKKKNEINDKIKVLEEENIKLNEKMEEYKKIKYKL